MITNPVGILALTRREIHRFLSVSFQSLFPPLVTSALFLYIFGVAIGNRIDFSSTGLPYFHFLVPGLMTLHLISSSYENTSFSLFIGRWHNHIHEILLAPLSYIEMVLGLLAGGVARGFMVCTGVYMISMFFEVIVVEHPFLLIFFMLMITVIFSCAGMLTALWAEDFGMLSAWNVYVIYPLVLMGGVFHPIKMLPKIIEIISQFNPMFYLIQGMRYSVTGVAEISVVTCAVVSFGMALFLFSVTVYLFRKGYKLRT